MPNKLHQLLLILIFGISTTSVASTTVVDISILQQTEFLNQIDLTFENDETVVVQPKFRKLKAVLLAVFLGHFGVHRIYLGTNENVPIVYSLTLGGGFGLLPLIAILTTKDLDEYANNNKVFMWSKKKTD